MQEDNGFLHCLSMQELDALWAETMVSGSLLVSNLNACDDAKRKSDLGTTITDVATISGRSAKCGPECIVLCCSGRSDLDRGQAI